MLQTKEKNLTSGSLFKQIILFSLPLMASNVLQVLFNMSDIAVVGRAEGDLALGEVGSTTILVTLFTGFLIGIGNGVNVFIARLIGERRLDKLKSAVLSSFITSAVIGLCLLAVGTFGAHALLQLIHTKEELLGGATLYLRIYFLSMPAVAIYNFGNAVFSARGKTGTPLVILAIAGVLNVVLNLFFVLACHLGVAGVAIASVISQYVSAALISLALFFSKTECALSFRAKPSVKDSLQVLRLGVPSGLQNGIFAIANLFIQSGVNSLATEMVEGNAAAANFDALVYDVMASVYMACSSFIGQNYGAKKFDRVKKSYLICLLYSFLAGLILGLSFVFFGRTFLKLFTGSPEVIEAGMQRLTILGFSYALSALMDTTIAASRGLGKTLIPMIIVICGSCLFRIAWIYTVFAHFRTIPSLYLLYSFSWTITGIAELIYFCVAFHKIRKAEEIKEN